MFLQLASSIAVRSGEENDANELRHFFPHFLWLLRDVHLTPVNDRGENLCNRVSSYKGACSW